MFDRLNARLPEDLRILDPTGHSGRRTFVSLCRRAQVSDSDIMVSSKHKSVESMEGYDEADATVGTRAAVGLGKYINQSPDTTTFSGVAMVDVGTHGLMESGTTGQVIVSSLAVSTTMGSPMTQCNDIREVEGKCVTVQKEVVDVTLSGNKRDFISGPEGMLSSSSSGQRQCFNNINITVNCTNGGTVNLLVPNNSQV